MKICKTMKELIRLTLVKNDWTKILRILIIFIVLFASTEITQSDQKIALNKFFP